MATAPKPGARRKTQEAAAVVRLTLKGETLEMPRQITIEERFAVQAATKYPLEFWWSDEDRISDTSLCVLWWLARRHNGEPRLAWKQHLAEWPDDLSPDDVALEVVEDDEEPTDDPEGSGPAS
jgi:hypothetical protein